jgi:hypothetical protein
MIRRQLCAYVLSFASVRLTVTLAVMALAPAGGSNSDAQAADLNQPRRAQSATTEAFGLGGDSDCNGNGIPDPTEAVIIHVDDDAVGLGDGSNWFDAHTDLQEALAAADSAVGEIHVAQGTYTPGELRTEWFLLRNCIAIRGGYRGLSEGGDPDDRDIDLFETVLSGEIGAEGVEDNSYHVVVGNETDPTAILDGFTVTRGFANGGGVDRRGAGMYNAAGSPTVTRCTFTENTAFGVGAGGGGMLNAAASNPTVIDCTFSANSAENTLSGVDFTLRAFGGAMFNSEGSNPTVVNCRFDGNSVTVDASSETEAVAESFGGAMYNGESNPTIINTIFRGNTTSTRAEAPTATAFAYGGALYNFGGIATLANCTIIDNATDAVAVQIDNGGTAGSFGGAMYNTSTGGATVSNSIIFGNRTALNTQQIFGDATVSYTCLENGWPGKGNINADPFLGRFHQLTAGSPCIDAGSNALVPPDTPDLDADGDMTEPIPFDLRSLPRFFDDPATPDTGIGDAPIVDMGAQEYGTTDCNANGFPDAQDIADRTSNDCNANAFPDECDLAGGGSDDLDGDGVPDECTDCDGNDLADACDRDCALGACADNPLCGLIADCNDNNVPDACDVLGGHDCCEISNRPGCSNAAIRDCVCAFDPFCCRTQWDRICAALVTGRGCFDCRINNDCNANQTPDTCDTINPGDFDADGDVDLNDFQYLMNSAAGPDVPPRSPDPACLGAYLSAFDYDSDGDIDLHDHATFQRQFTSPP